MSVRDLLKNQVSKLSDEQLLEFEATNDKTLWVEYNVLDTATPMGLSKQYADLAEDMIEERMKET